MGAKLWHKHSEETKKKISISKKGTSFGCKFKIGHIHSPETIEKLRKASKINNPRYWLGKNRSEKTKRKISISLLNINKDYITPEFRKKCGDFSRGKTYEEIYGEEASKKLKNNLSKIKTGFRHTPETKNKIRKNTIKQIQDGNLPKSRNTDIEIIMKNKLDELGIKYIQQYNFNNIFICDFYIPSMNTIIECDGKYWHLSSVKRRSDSYKNIKLKENYRVLRFSDIMIKKRIEDCINILFNNNIKFFTWIDSYGWEVKLVGKDEKEILKKLKLVDDELKKTYTELNLEEVKQNG